MKKLIIILLFPFLIISQTDRKTFSEENLFTVFYNVENLFDTIKNPNTQDNEFLPNSTKKWNTDKYYYKLNQLKSI